MNDIVNELGEKNLENITNEKKWKRDCPRCRKELRYKKFGDFNSSSKKNSVCRGCSNVLFLRIKKIRKITPISDLERICSFCGNKIIYTHKWNRDDAIRKNKWCKKCKIKYFRPTIDQIENQRSKVMGRKHTTEQRKKISEASKKYIRTDEWYRKIGNSNRGKKELMKPENY